MSKNNVISLIEKQKEKKRLEEPDNEMQAFQDSYDAFAMMVDTLLQQGYDIEERGDEFDVIFAMLHRQIQIMKDVEEQTRMVKYIDHVLEHGFKILLSEEEGDDLPPFEPKK